MLAPSPADLLAWLTANKDALEAVGKVVGGVGAVSGASWKAYSWYKKRRRRPGAPHQAPPLVKSFQGRTRELLDLQDLVVDQRRRLIGLFGLPGLGKTELTKALVHRLASRFPDGDIWLDLEGASDHPLQAPAIRRHIVRALGGRLPTNQAEQELVGYFRTLVADRCAILVLDNLADAAQVESVLPLEHWLVILTGRTRVPLEGLHSVDLGPLPEAAAIKLLGAIAPALKPYAADVAARCHYLPLALRTVALAVASSPSPVDDVVTRLQHARRALEPIDAALDVSLSLLPAALRSRWLMLGVFPSSFDRPAAAAVWGVLPPSDAARLSPGAPDLCDSADDLDALVRRSLLVPDAPGRYRLHDLTRDFTAARLTNDDTLAARARFAAYYAAVLSHTDDLIVHGGDDTRQARALVDREWTNVEAGHAWAVANATSNDDAAQTAVAYPLGAPDLLSLVFHPRDRIAWLEPALAAARRLGDRWGEGTALGNLGNAYDALGDPRRAIAYHEQHLVIAREIGDRRGEGAALGNLGIAYADLGDPRRAIEFYEQRLAIAREIGDRQGEGQALGNLGIAYAALGDPRRAITYYEQVLAILRDIGDRQGEGQDLGNLGNAYRTLGDPRRAITYYEQALAIAHEIGDRRGEGQALGNLGLAYDDLGEFGQATEYALLALEIAREIGDRRGEGHTLGLLGVVRHHQRDYAEAVRFFRDQRAIALETGDRRSEAEALWNSALAVRRLGKPRDALILAEAALAIFVAVEAPDVDHLRETLERWRQEDATLGSTTPKSAPASPPPASIVLRPTSSSSITPPRTLPRRSRRRQPSRSTPTEPL